MAESIEQIKVAGQVYNLGAVKDSIKVQTITFNINDLPAGGDYYRNGKYYFDVESGWTPLGLTGWNLDGAWSTKCNISALKIVHNTGNNYYVYYNMQNYSDYATVELKMVVDILLLKTS